MHIPDGFLSPQTCVACWAVAAPVWYVAWTKIKSRFETTTAAHIGLAAAFIFLLQMVNVPIPGGTSGHATGSALVAIALGPSTAIISASLALLLQAVVFGDGGIWAFGANVVSMAIVQSVVAWGIWRVIVKEGASRKLKLAGAFAAGLIAPIFGGLTTGLLLGAQPMLFKDAAGAPLYFPLGLAVSVPAMLTSHVLIGLIEGAITAGAVGVLLRLPEFNLASPMPLTARRRLQVALGIMIFLVPAGLILPALMNAGDPWGEWGPEEAAEVAGQSTVPAGMVRYSDNYPAPVPDYQFTEAASMTGESLQYIGAAMIGVLLVVVLCLPLHRVQQRRLERSRQA